MCAFAPQQNDLDLKNVHLREFAGIQVEGKYGSNVKGRVRHEVVRRGATQVLGMSFSITSILLFHTICIGPKHVWINSFCRSFFYGLDSTSPPADRLNIFSKGNPEKRRFNSGH